MATTEFVDTLRAIMANDNAIRSAAEKRFSDAKSQQPGTTVAALFQTLAQPQLEEPLREQAAVLLRQCLAKLREDDSPWSKLGAQAQTESKAQLLQLFQVEAQSKVRRKLADCIQSLGNQLIDVQDGERPQNIQVWPELLPLLLRIITDNTKDAELRADALWTVKELITTIWPVLLASRDQTGMVMKGCLADPSLPVQANAACMFCELLDSIESKEDRAAFMPMVVDLCGALQRVAEGGEAKDINQVLQSMEGTNNSVDFFKDHVGSHLLPVLRAVAKSHKAEDTRRLALEVLISFAETKPKAMSKVPGYIEQTLDIAVGFLMELSDDVNTWAEEDEDEAEDDEQFTNGKEVVDRLCRSMNKAEKFPQVMEVLKPVLGSFMQSSEWKQVVAAITVLSQIAEYVDDEAMVTQMMAGIKVHLKSSDPRIRHAAWSAVAQLAEDHDDFVTAEALSAQLLPEFLAALDDPCKRVAARSMEAFQLYGQACEREILEPFVRPMMEKLGQKLQSNQLSIQRHTVTFIAVIAGQVEDDFAPYYGQLMPVLKQLIGAVLHNTEERTLLGKAFECVSLLAKAVGSAGFRADAESIMQAMTQAASVPDLPANDPVKEYMLQAAQRICWTMKADFLPFVPHILPGILEKFKLAPQELDSSTRDGIGDEEEVNLALVPDKDGKVKVMVMSTSAMEDLSNALECVHTFVEELGKVYAPFVAQTAQALLPVFDFSMAEQIRDMAFETWGELCNAAHEGGNAEVLSQLVREFLQRILPKMESGGGDNGSVDAGALKTLADGVAACLKKAGQNVLVAEQLKHICQVALGVLSASFERREAMKAASKAAPQGEEEDAGDEEDDEDEPALRIACCEVIGALMKGHADIFAAEVMPLVLPVVDRLIQPTVPVEDRKLAIFVVCDFLEHLQQRVTAQWPQFMPQVLRDVMNPSAEIRQPACYGTSLAARNPAFASVAADAAKSLMQVISESRSRAKKKSEKPAQACADNALSALVEILLHHQQVVAGQEAQMWSVWVQGLPCQEDEEEGKKNHAMLLQLVVSEKREVVGEAGANLAQVLSILVDVYKTDMASEDTSKGIGQLVLKVGSNLEQLAAQLKEKQRKKLTRIHREATQGA